MKNLSIRPFSLQDTELSVCYHDHIANHQLSDAEAGDANEARNRMP
ncbi:hypothetical protein KKI93_03730 [Xenorhabdus bovienii]|nr:hypothetical protein [Xenorhabdus bovienii]MDE9563202.1 hypothetical protein [Xenorhabdus bovienii]